MNEHMPYRECPWCREQGREWVPVDEAQMARLRRVTARWERLQSAACPRCGFVVLAVTEAAPESPAIPLGGMEIALLVTPDGRGWGAKELEPLGVAEGMGLDEITRVLRDHVEPRVPRKGRGRA